MMSKALTSLSDIHRYFFIRFSIAAWLALLLALIVNGILYVTQSAEQPDPWFLFATHPLILALIARLAHRPYTRRTGILFVIGLMLYIVHSGITDTVSHNSTIAYGICLIMAGMTAGSGAMARLAPLPLALVLITPADWVTKTEIVALTTFVALIAWFVIRKFEDVIANQARVIGDRTRELEQAFAALQAYTLQSEELARIKERTRIARDMHDGLGHYLTAIHAQLGALQAGMPPEQAETHEILAILKQLSKESMAEIRRSITALRELPQDDDQLIGKLRGLVNESTGGGVPTSLRISGEQRAIRPPVALMLFRVAQEGLTNVRKHASASRATVSLEYRGGGLRLSVSDDGGGAASTATGGYGLRGIEERVADHGGGLRIVTAPGQGFTIEVEVPDD